MGVRIPLLLCFESFSIAFIVLQFFKKKGSIRNLVGT